MANLEEVPGGLEAIINVPGENDLGAIAQHYGRDPKVFVIGIFDAVMLKALTTVVQMTALMLKKIPLTVDEHLEAQDEVLIASSTTSRLKDQHNSPDPRPPPADQCSPRAERRDLASSALPCS